MLRMQACLQIWPDVPNVEPGVMTVSAPLRSYKLVDSPLHEHLCIPSSEIIWLSLLKAGLRLARFFSFPTQVLGAFRATLIVFAAISFHVYLCRRKEFWTALVHSLIFSLVIADPANALYFNTFYTEFAALFTLYISFILLWITLSASFVRWASISLGIALILLGLSKYQHVALPLIFVLLAAICWRGKSTKWSTAILLLALGAIVLLYSVIPEFSRAPHSYNYYINYANATDSILGAILPSTTVPEQASLQLGLPSRCFQYSGVTWYTPGVQEEHPCPEVLEVNRLRTLILVFNDSRFLYNITTEALPRLRPWLLDYLGAVGEGEFEQITVYRPSLSTLLDRLPSDALALSFVTPLVVAAILLLRQLRSGFENRRSLCFISAMVACGYIVFYSALFGDGFIEFAKHATLYFSIQISLAIIAITYLFKISLRRLRFILSDHASTNLIDK